jgi:hypothetical protein
MDKNKIKIIFLLEILFQWLVYFLSGSSGEPTYRRAAVHHLQRKDELTRVRQRSHHGYTFLYDH